MPYAAATRVLPCMAAKASLRWKLATISGKKKRRKRRKKRRSSSTEYAIALDLSAGKLCLLSLTGSAQAPNTLICLFLS